MAIQWSDELRNLWIADTETTIGTAPTIKIRTGTAPATCEDADTGTVLATIVLPSDWLTAPSNGAASKIGTWQDASADNTGTMGHFRLYDSGGDCHLQGTVGTSGADMTVSSTTVSTGSTFTISTCVVTAIGA